MLLEEDVLREGLEGLHDLPGRLVEYLILSLLGEEVNPDGVEKLSKERPEFLCGLLRNQVDVGMGITAVLPDCTCFLREISPPRSLSKDASPLVSDKIVQPAAAPIQDKIKPFQCQWKKQLQRRSPFRNTYSLLPIIPDRPHLLPLRPQYSVDVFTSSAGDGRPVLIFKEEKMEGIISYWWTMTDILTVTGWTLEDRGYHYQGDLR
jgi:hypothetical protein